MTETRRGLQNEILAYLNERGWWESANEISVALDSNLASTRQALYDLSAKGKVEHFSRKWRVDPKKEATQ